MCAMNDENLIRNEDLTPSQRRENARKAGKASVRARRDKRDSKERMKMLMSLPCPDGEGGILKSDITGKPVSVGEALDIALIKKGLSGNVKAICAIYDLLGLYEIRVKTDSTIRTQTLEEIDAELERLRRIDEQAEGKEDKNRE